MEFKQSAFAVVLHVIFITQCVAQNYSIPSSWRKPNVTLSIDDRKALAGRALAKLVPSLNTTTGFLVDRNAFQVGEIYSQMAMFDLYTNGTIYKNQVLSGLTKVNSSFAQFQNEFLNYALQYGVASVRAYKAYSDPVFLDLAEGSWTFGSAFTLTQADIDRGTFPFKSFSLQKSCQQLTMAGGTFWETDFDEPSLNAIGSGYMLILSSHLAETTSNKIYTDAARLSANFIHNHLYNVAGIVQDSISASASDSCRTSPTSGPYNAGDFLEGLAVLADFTKDPALISLVRDTTSASIQTTNWQDADGISGNSDIFRGLLEVYTRNPSDESFRDYIKAYLSVQYNAIVDLAAAPGNDTYAGSWKGPAPNAYDWVNQTNAVVPLMGMIAVNTSNSSVAPPIPSSSPPPDSHAGSSSSKVASIVGGVLGAVMAILLLLVGIMIYKRKRARQLRQETDIPVQENDPPAVLVPYGLPSHEGYVYTPLLPTSLPSHSASSPSNEEYFSTREVPPQMQNFSATEKRRPRPTPTGGPQSDVSPAGSHSGVNLAPSNDSSREHRDYSGVQNNPSFPSSGGPSSRSDDLSTAELVQLLNNRLQSQNTTWDETEAPPGYQPTHS